MQIERKIKDTQNEYRQYVNGRARAFDHHKKKNKNDLCLTGVSSGGKELGGRERERNQRKGKEIQF